jgi:hypothetical protein
MSQDMIKFKWQIKVSGANRLDRTFRMGIENKAVVKFFNCETTWYTGASRLATCSDQYGCQVHTDGPKTEIFTPRSFTYGARKTNKIGFDRWIYTCIHEISARVIPRAGWLTGTDELVRHDSDSSPTKNPKINKIINSKPS